MAFNELTIDSAFFRHAFDKDYRVGDEVTLLVRGKISGINADVVDVTQIGGPSEGVFGALTATVYITEIEVA